MSVTNDLTIAEANSTNMDEFDVQMGIRMGVAKFAKDAVQPTSYISIGANLETKEISKNKFEALIAQGAVDLSSTYDI